MALLEQLLQQAGVQTPTPTMGGGDSLAVPPPQVPGGLLSQPAPLPPPQQPPVAPPAQSDSLKLKSAIGDFVGNTLFALGRAMQASAQYPGGRGTRAGIGAALESPMLLEQAKQAQMAQQQEQAMKQQQMELQQKQAQQGDVRVQLEALDKQIQLMREQREAAKKPPIDQLSPEGIAARVQFEKQKAEMVPSKPAAPPTMTPTNVSLDGKPALVLRDQQGNFYDAQTKQPITGRITPYVAPPTPRQKGEITPTAEANLIQGLSGQWGRAAKDVQDLYRANTIMDAGLQAARRGDMNAGSQAILVTFQKFLDPTSVVRESEYARSGAGLAMAERIRGYIDKLQQGGAGVTLPELEKFAQLGKEINNRLAAEGNSLLSSEKKRISSIADRYSIPSELVIPQYNYANPGGSPQPAPATKAGPSDIKNLSTDELLKRLSK